MSSSLIKGKQKDKGSLARVPAAALETLVLAQVGAAMNEASLEWAAARDMIARVTVSADEITIALVGGATDGEESQRIIKAPVRLGRRGGAAFFLDGDGRPISETESIDPILVQAIARAWRWRGLLTSGTYASSTDLANAEGLSFTAMNRVLRLAYLAPDILRDILDGRQRPGLTLDQLARMTLPLDWESQRRLIGRIN